MLIKVSFDTVFILIISFQGKHSKSCVCVCVCVVMKNLTKTVK
jgi:hypothetical protein